MLIHRPVTAGMTLGDFDYDLPKALIAQDALRERTSARLLVLEKESGRIQHRHFPDCLEFFEKGDLLILNDTKVLPVRLFGKKESGGSVEALLLEDKGENLWTSLLRPSGRIRENQTITFGDREFPVPAKVMDAPRASAGIRLLQFPSSLDLKKMLEIIGRIPLPPYIDRPDTEIDRALYQTVFARKAGAVASPTAGLHFDEKLLARIEAKGVRILYVTLHVGYGTFQSVTVDNLSEHKMHAEFFEIPEETAEEINFAKSAGRRVIACGTTVVRTLEACAVESIPAEVRAAHGKTDFFIYPPYEFKIVDAMITNFHLPRTTLLMLVAAFTGLQNMKDAYQEAIRERYRFYSYGDAMLIQ